MIKCYHEAPKSIFKQVQSLTDGDYALVNMFEEDKEYYGLFKEAVEQGRDVILDNGVFELGEAFDSDVFAGWVAQLKPTWYIVPDVLENGEATIDRFIQFIKQYGSHIPGKIIGVAQGKDYKDFVKCYKAIEPYCDMVGISFDCSWYREIIDNTNPWEQLAKGRLKTLITMYNTGIINKNKPHHLLGVALPQEMSSYNKLQLNGVFRWIRSVDTSNPVIHGLKGIRYTADGLTTKETQKLYTMINAKPTDDQINNIVYNIKEFRRYLS